MTVVNRRELKYGISETDYCTYVNLFQNVLTPDSHSHDGSYRVRSLYFDSLNNDDYYSKMGGEEIRKKIRLRIYKCSDQVAKLEIKRKININQIKETVTISKEDALQLIQKNYHVLLKYESKTAQTIYNIMVTNQYAPVVLIDYDRRAFMHQENNIRVTLDHNIRASETNFDMFNEHVLLNPVFTHYNTILEVKYNGDIFCWITDVVKGKDTVHQSLSKYCVSRQFFDNYLA